MRGRYGPTEEDYVLGRTKQTTESSGRSKQSFAAIAVNGPPVEAILSVVATLDFPNTAAQTSSDLTIAVEGAQAGDPVFLGVPNGSVNANSDFAAWVSATGVVSVRFSNYSAGAINPASGTFTVVIFHLGS